MCSNSLEARSDAWCGFCPWNTAPLPYVMLYSPTLNSLSLRVIRLGPPPAAPLAVCDTRRYSFTFGWLILFLLPLGVMFDCWWSLLLALDDSCELDWELLGKTNLNLGGLDFLPPLMRPLWLLLLPMVKLSRFTDDEAACVPEQQNPVRPTPPPRPPAPTPPPFKLAAAFRAAADGRWKKREIRPTAPIRSPVTAAAAIPAALWFDLAELFVLL